MNVFAQSIVERCNVVIAEIVGIPEADRIDVINQVKIALHEVSPFRGEPVDCVLWLRGDRVEANDYNPNVVAPTEMRSLERSIEADGYTQPVVVWLRDAVNSTYEEVVTKIKEVVDGFHRNRVGKESKKISQRIRGYLPVTIVNLAKADRGSDKADRMASTIRHNRARGKHGVEPTSDIVVDLYRRGWSDEKIARELGMDADEVLRLKQISGLAEAFADRDFSQAWEIKPSDIQE